MMLGSDAFGPHHQAFVGLAWPVPNTEICVGFELIYHLAAALPRLGPSALVPLPLAAVETSQAGDEGLMLVALQQALANHLQLPKLELLEAAGTGLHLSSFISSSSWNKTVVLWG